MPADCIQSGIAAGSGAGAAGAGPVGGSPRSPSQATIVSLAPSARASSQGGSAVGSGSGGGWSATGAGTAGSAETPGATGSDSITASSAHCGAASGGPAGAPSRGAMSLSQSGSSPGARASSVAAGGPPVSSWVSSSSEKDTGLSTASPLAVPHPAACIQSGMSPSAPGCAGTCAVGWAVGCAGSGASGSDSISCSHEGIGPAAGALCNRGWLSRRRSTPIDEAQSGLLSGLVCPGVHSMRSRRTVPASTVCGSAMAFSRNAA